jgi:hypothetical protein
MGCSAADEPVAAGAVGVPDTLDAPAAAGAPAAPDEVAAPGAFAVPAFVTVGAWVASAGADALDAFCGAL